MSLEIEGHVAFVTGAGSGMGRAAVQRFAEEGMRVCAVDIDDGALDELVRSTGCVAVAADVSAPEQVEQAVTRCVAELGAIDLAFLNAGIASNMTVSNFDLATYRKVTGVNVDGVVFGIDAVSRSMRARTDGRTGGAIVVTASTAGLRPFAGDPYYSLTKFALVGFARSVAPVLAADGIAVHTVCPGLTDTGFVSGVVREKLEEAGVGMIPASAVADAVLRVAAEPIGTAGTVWVIEDPDHLEPVPFVFNEPPPNAASLRMKAILTGQ